MKRTFLLFVTGTVMSAAYGQGPRWYKFTTDLFDAYQSSFSKFVGSSEAVLWPDTSAIIGYTTTAGTPVYYHSQVITAGLGFNPTYTSTVVPGYGWNECGAIAIRDYTGEMAMTATDAYTIDSVYIGGWYRRNPSKPLVVDTLILTLIKSPRTGSGIDLAMVSLSTIASCYGIMSLSYRELWRDLVNGRAAHNGGTPTTNVYKFLLTNTDTNYYPNKHAVYPRPTHPADPVISYTVAPNEVVAASVSFRSGDATYPVFPLQDTIRTSSGTSIIGYKYGAYSLQVNYATNSSISGSPAECPFYDSTGDCVGGYFGYEGGGFPWHNAKYYPNWDLLHTLSSGIAPASDQFPNIGFHTQCATCHLITCSSASADNTTNLQNVTIAPNPVRDEVHISFSSSPNEKVTVSLMNMFGRVVASQLVFNGKAEISTANLPAGIYMYAIQNSTDRATGRISIVH